MDDPGPGFTIVDVVINSCLIGLILVFLDAFIFGTGDDSQEDK